MPRSFLAFTLATLAPIPFLVAGALFGGWACWIALLYITLFVAAVDEFGPVFASDGEAADDEEADQLSLMLVLVHFVLLALMVWSLSGKGIGLFSLDGVALFAATGLFMGQVSNSNAHELIHRGARGLRRAGTWVYISLLFGHHASAHPLVHHVHVGTPNDPNTSRMNESFYRFVRRAWVGSFKKGLAAETARRAQLERAQWDYRHPYVLYVGGAIALLFVSFLIGGLKGVGVHLCLAAFAQTQLMLSDYVQHYGLERAADGARFEPVTAKHSWNAPHWLSSLWMLGAPRHSDHHAHPGKRFTALENPVRGEAPMLPHALPVMAFIALYPKLWKKVMNPHAEAWRAA
ncbi:alkane 1-monooxygenase [Litoreibacter ponti]|uniref:Alkane 1-monooxygenase n=1 Tax=Litoreibacter ponti TaxID=1510457 RepID=A0A2T6BK15_9RHOB|nr:alkane 1-monooxygenase [Litoreibacter ponti]PTX56410.1 alkane 1-monooxygenase [Litoreibacter ponti]